MKEILKNKQFLYVFFIVVMIISMASFAVLEYDYGIFSYEIGDVARGDIVLEVDVVDNQMTALLRQAAIDEVEPVEYLDITIQINVRKDLEYFFETLKETKKFHSNDAEILKNVYFGIERNNKYLLNEEELKSLAIIDDDRLTVYKNTIMDTTSEFLSSGITDNGMEDKTNQVNSFIDSLNDFSDVEKNMAKKIINSSLVVNVFEDVDKTAQAKQRAYDDVYDVIVSKGTVLVTEGSYMTADAIRVMQEADMLLENRRTFGWIAGMVFLIVVFWMVLGIVLVYGIRIKSLNQLFIFQVVFTLIFMVCLYLPLKYNGLLLIPLLSMLLSLIGSPMVGFIYGLVFIMIMTVLKPLSAEMTVMYIGSIILITLMVNRYTQRRQLMITGAVVAAVHAFFYSAYNIINGLSFVDFYEMIFIVALNGIISAILALGTLPIIEIVFKVLTPIKLMELTNPNQPLLKRMLVEAPGTYHHSIIVGNLAETAAHAIECDYLLARVGAHYHDIGKLQRPYYFKENQLGDENIHDQLEAVISAGIIKSHVSHGEHLAKKFKLPDEIISIINEHHGTTLIKYFYHKAVEEANEEDSVGVSQYTYEGPTPKSKESAIVMLADSVEAAVRSLNDHSDDSILKMVKSIFNQKMDDGQLNHCDLTLKELETIQLSFIKVLSGIFHDRVQYPKEEE